jgi:hypothetical protein
MSRSTMETAVSTKSPISNLYPHAYGETRTFYRDAPTHKMHGTPH